MSQANPLTLKEIFMELIWYLKQTGGNKSKPLRKPAPQLNSSERATEQTKRPAGESRGPEGEKAPFTLEGELNGGVRTICSIGGQEFIIGPKTWVVGTIEPGAFARVKGVMKKDEKYATNIVIGKERGARAPVE